MEFSNVLTNLINAGADAPANLYLVSFFEETHSEDAIELADPLTIRTGNFNIPEVAANTVEFPYLNDVYHKPVPSSNINKIGSFSLRVDEYFKCYNYLKDKVAVYETGDWKEDIDSLLVKKITVKYVNSADLTQAIKTWSFEDCYILSVGSFSYDYGNSNPISVPVKFTWGLLNKES